MFDQHPYLLNKTKSSLSQHGYRKKLILQLDGPSDSTSVLQIGHNNYLYSNQSNRKSIYCESDMLSKSKIQSIAQMHEMFRNFKHFKNNIQNSTPISKQLQQSQTQSKYTLDELSFDDKQQIMNQSRKTMFKIVMNSKLRSQSIKDYGFNLRPLFNKVIEQNDSIVEQRMQEKRQKKRKSDLLQRNPLQTAYYAAKALSKKSRMNVFQALPKESRFL